MSEFDNVQDVPIVVRALTQEEVDTIVAQPQVYPEEEMARHADQVSESFLKLQAYSGAMADMVKEDLTTLKNDYEVFVKRLVDSHQIATAQLQNEKRALVVQLRNTSLELDKLATALMSANLLKSDYRKLATAFGVALKRVAETHGAPPYQVARTMAYDVMEETYDLRESLVSRDLSP